jgi:hypothetical protein
LLEVPLEIWNGFQMFGKTIGDWFFVLFKNRFKEIVRTLRKKKHIKCNLRENETNVEKP